MCCGGRQVFQFTVGEVFTNAPLNMISWISDFLVTDQGGRRVLYAASRSGGGVIAIGIDGGMTLLDQISLSVNTALSAPPSLDIVSFAGKPRLVMSGTNQTTLLTYQIDTTDPLGKVVRPAGGPAGVVSAQELLTAGAQTWFYAATTNSGMVGAYEMAADGTLTLLQVLELVPPLQGINVSELQLVSVGDARFLAAALPGADGIALMGIGTDGRLTVLATIGAAQGLGINDPSALAVTVAHGATYLLVAAGSSSSLSVIEVGADGSLTVRDHVVDTLGTRFQGVLAFDSFTVGGRSFVVLGGGDGGLDLLEILPDGRLIHLTQILDTAATTMAGISAITATVIGSTVEIFVAGEGAGITRLVLNLSALGAVRMGGSGADSLTGTTGDDLLWGGTGADVLTGGAGDDVLVDGAGADTLSGGAGADLFVLLADGQRDVITDFQPGIDRLDLSAWGAIHDLSALTFTPTANGILIQYRDEVLEIRSANGLPLQPSQFRVTDLFPLWHLPSVLRDSEGRIRGSETADHLFGSADADLFLWSPGRDTLEGGAGVDQVDFAAAGAAITVDLLYPSLNAGAASGQVYHEIEEILATALADAVYGSEGSDGLMGQGGADTLAGRGGNDRLYGGAGDDILVGGAGADLLEGGAGHDIAGYWNSTVGIVIDMVGPGAGTGEAAGDRFVGIEEIIGSNHADTISGDADGNVLDGGAGDDRLLGREGDDTLRGGAGNDQLLGGAGADLLIGGAGWDTAAYWYASTGVTVDLLMPAANTGEAQGDVFQDVEAVSGTVFGDTLNGDGAGNFLNGYLGNDMLSGRDGADTLLGDAGDDVLIGGAGADFIYGGEGFDHAGYWGAAAGVVVDLLAPSANKGEAAGDIFAGIEAFSGSAHADTLAGDNLANYLSGWLGNDLLLGRAGADTLVGDAGDDLLIGGAGADRLFGDAGFDQAAYWYAPGTVVVYLATPVLNQGEAAGDTFDGVEGLSGSTFNDWLIGDAGNNYINGYLGNDALYGAQGNDTLVGDAGDDTLYGGPGDDLLVGGAGADRFVFDGGHDRIQDFTDDVDEIVLSRALWNWEARDIAWVLSQATLVPGGVQLAFGSGSTLYIAGITDLQVLADDLIIV